MKRKLQQKQECLNILNSQPKAMPFDERYWPLIMTKFDSTPDYHRLRPSGKTFTFVSPHIKRQSIHSISFINLSLCR